MDTTHHNPGSSSHDYVPSPAEIAVGHELRDTSLRSVILFAVIFSSSIAIVIFFIVGVQRVMNAMQENEYDQTNAPHPWVEGNPNFARTPPGSPLEPSVYHDLLPHEDLKLNREREQKLLTTGGTVDFDNGIVRVPLKDVQDYVVENGLPTTLPATQPSVPTIPHGSAQYFPGGNP